MDSRPTPQRRHLVAVWFADIVGYSHLASANEDDAVRLVEAFQAVVQEEVARGEGRVVKYIGDAALAEFHSTEQAARAACALVDAFAERTGASLRVGLHVGEVAIADGEDLLGDGVNLAARLQAEAEPGEVVCSEDAWRQLRQREAFQFQEVGRRRLRGQADAVRVFRVCMVGEGEPRSAIAAARPYPGMGARLAGGVGGVLRKRNRGVRRTASIALLVAIAAFIFLSVGTGWDRLAGRAEAGRSDLSSSEPADVVVPDFDPARLAVLYFEDYSPDGQLEYLANSLTEALIHELTQVSGLSVISRNGVKPFKEGAASLDSIARMLRVGSIVQGSVARSQNRARVTVQLIDPVSGTPLQSSVVEQPLDDHLALQDSVVSMVASVLRKRLGREIRLRMIEHSTESEKAYELYLHGRMAWEEFVSLRGTDADAAERALLRGDSIFAQAEDQDPGWVAPVVQRGWVQRELSLLNGPVSGRLDSLWSREALRTAERAVAMGGPAALELRGTLRLELGANAQGADRNRLFQQAETDLRQATALDPSRAFAWVKLSEVFLQQARFAEAVYAARQSMEADAFLAEAENALHSIYYATLQLGPVDEASRLCEEGRTKFPASEEFILCRLFVLASFPQVPPDLNHARALIDSLVSVVPQDLTQTYLAYGTMLSAQVAARAGLRDSAERLIHEARRVGPEVPLGYNEAHARLLLGDADSALSLLSDWLEVEADTAYLANDWWFASLRSNPRFRAILARDQSGAVPTGIP